LQNAKISAAEFVPLESEIAEPTERMKQNAAVLTFATCLEEPHRKYGERIIKNFQSKKIFLFLRI
jgi:hypothetical protein